MANPKRPTGDKITVGPEERARFKMLREAKKLDQKEVGRMVGVSGATISNLETGRHPQIYRETYVKLKMVLQAETPERMSAGEAYKAIANEVSDLAESDQQVVLSVIRTLKKTRGG